MAAVLDDHDAIALLKGEQKFDMMMAGGVTTLTFFTLSSNTTYDAV
jgi:hypothetical protein